MKPIEWLKAKKTLCILALQKGCTIAQIRSSIQGCIDYAWDQAWTPGNLQAQVNWQRIFPGGKKPLWSNSLLAWHSTQTKYKRPRPLGRYPQSTHQHACFIFICLIKNYIYIIYLLFIYIYLLRSTNYKRGLSSLAELIPPKATRGAQKGFISFLISSRQAKKKATNRKRGAHRKSHGSCLEGDWPVGLASPKNS